MLLTSPFAVSSSPFLNGGSSTPLSRLPKSSPTILPIRAIKTIEGLVVKTTRDKTVAVEVTRLVQHPKYHRRVRIKTLFHAHDPDSKFQIGDLVELQRSRPISKTKNYIAIPAPPRGSKKKNKVSGGEDESSKEELGIPFESQQLQS
ncbi:30S ribosomal protein S17, chloroplastic [Linum perenne]